MFLLLDLRLLHFRARPAAAVISTIALAIAASITVIGLVMALGLVLAFVGVVLVLALGLVLAFIAMVAAASGIATATAAGGVAASIAMTIAMAVAMAAALAMVTISMTVAMPITVTITMARSLPAAIVGLAAAIISAFFNQHIRPRSAIEAVGSASANQRVICIAAQKRVIAGPAKERIRARSADQRIIPRSTNQHRRDGNPAIGLIDRDLVITGQAEHRNAVDRGRSVRLQSREAAGRSIDVHIQLGVIRGIQRDNDVVRRFCAHDRQDAVAP